MKIGAVSYLNTKPLIATLAKTIAPKDELLLDLPSRLAGRLARQELDIGLIPIVEFFRGPESFHNVKNDHSDERFSSDSSYRILSNAMIGCRGIVRSVRLFFRTFPGNVRTLAIDEGSKTSVALSKILLAELFGVHPETVPLPIASNPDAVDADAVLVIGDRAMHPSRFTSFTSDWDLGKKWYEHTGLPFVFATWVGRANCYSEFWRERFEVARDEGLEMLDELSHSYASSYQLSHSDCMTYLGSNLRFTMESEDLLGMKVFFDKGVKWGLISSDQRPIWPTLSDGNSLVEDHSILNS